MPIISVEALGRRRTPQTEAEARSVGGPSTGGPRFVGAIENNLYYDGILDKNRKVNILVDIYRNGSATDGQFYSIPYLYKKFVGANSLNISAIIDWSKENSRYYGSIGDNYQAEMGGVETVAGISAEAINSGNINVSYEFRLFSLFQNDWLLNSSSINKVFYIDFLRFLNLYDIYEPVPYYPPINQPPDRFPNPPRITPPPGPGGPSVIAPPGSGTIPTPPDRLPSPPRKTNPPGPGGPNGGPPTVPTIPLPPDRYPNPPRIILPPDRYPQPGPGPGPKIITPPDRLEPAPESDDGTKNGNQGGTSGGSGGNAYVRYIQYTMHSYGIQSVPNSGIYNNATATAVRSFQTRTNINVDGIVDSQTKAALATFWLNLLKNNKTKYDSLYNAAPNQIKVYIRNATKYSDIGSICNPSSSDEYRRISYTGSEGPTRIQDHIVVEVPRLKDKNGNFFPWQEVVSVDVRTGGWPARINQIYFYEQDLAASSHRIPEFGSGAIKAIAQNKDAVNQVIQPNSVFQFAAKNRRRIRYVMLEVVGNKLNDGVHGQFAEGFSIKDVSFSIKTPGTPSKATDPTYIKLDDVKTTATATLTMYGQTQIRSGDVGAFNLGTLTAALANSGQSKVTDINLKTISLSVTPIEDGKPIVDADGNVVTRSFSKSFEKGVFTLNEKNLLSEKYEWDQDECTIDVEPLSTSTAISNANPVIVSVKRRQGSESVSLTSSEISEQFSISNKLAPKYIVTTNNGVEVISREFSEDFRLPSDFYLADADITGLRSKQNKKKSINAKDGVVVLTDEIGNAVGLPDYSRFIQQPDVDVSFGLTILGWGSGLAEATVIGTDVPLGPPPYGLQWGFYNIRTRQFLGTKLSYQYIMANRPDIYLGVHAFDADRNVDTMENVIGIDNRVDTLREFEFPAKSICPIYSVKISPRSKISISSPPKDLSKFDTWFINLSRGRFYKKIELPLNYNFIDWKKNYKGMTLRCFYDTTQIKVPSSVIFGTGYYDIWEENPIIVSDREIQLRHGSFAVVQEQVDKEGVNLRYTDASEIVPWFEIEIKNSLGNWEKLQKEFIDNYSKHTGKISFTREIIPSDNKNIRVNYTIKNPNIMLYHINGKEIPLNPYVEISGHSYSSFNILSGTSYSDTTRPVHYYLMPSSIEELVDGEYVSIPEYTKPTSVVDFTHNYNIFSTLSLDYDPFALYLGSSVINNSFNIENVELLDLRVKGGGLAQDANLEKEMEKNQNILSFNDIKSGKGKTYPAGGYVIVKIPIEVRDAFRSIDEVYQVVRANLTAGVAFDIQDLQGNDWKTLI